MVNLAAQAGVRYSIENPAATYRRTLWASGTSWKAAAARCGASGVCQQQFGLWRQHADAFSEQQSVDHPVSLYAASKKANELMTPTSAWFAGYWVALFHRVWTLRRPDMALFVFTKDVEASDSGVQQRPDGADFTYVDDITESLMRLLENRRPLIQALTSGSQPFHQLGAPPGVQHR